MNLSYFFGLFWAAPCFWLLYAGLTTPPPVDVKDIHVGMVIWMSLLSFPSSLLVFFGFEFGPAAFGSYYFSVAWDYHPWFYCIVWACYFVAGLAQWLFVVRRTIGRTPTVEAGGQN